MKGREGQAAEPVLVGKMRQFAEECLRRIEINPHTDGDELHTKCTYQDILKLCDMAQPCGPSQPETAADDEWWKVAALDVIRHARVDGDVPTWDRWRSCIINGLLGAFNRGQDSMRAPSPSTPIVPGTAGLSAEQVQRIVELHHNDGIFLWASMTADLNALFGAKPAECPCICCKDVGQGCSCLSHDIKERCDCLKCVRHMLSVKEFVVTGVVKQREAQIRKDVLEEAARYFLSEVWIDNPDNSPLGIAEAIRALAERPAPAGKVKAFGTFTCPICGKDSPHSHPELELAGLSMAQTISAILNHRGLIGLDELAALCGKTLAEEWHKREVKGEK